VSFLAMTPNVVESARFNPSSFFFGRLGLTDRTGLASIGVRVAMPATGWPEARRLAAEPERVAFVMEDEIEVREVEADCHDFVRAADD
jgi:hypothetical protein